MEAKERLTSAALSDMCNNFPEAVFGTTAELIEYLERIAPLSEILSPSTTPDNPALGPHNVLYVALSETAVSGVTLQILKSGHRDVLPSMPR
jgi:hypothetical protein